MSGKVLHILSQRPGRTGSGVTLDALVRQAGAAGWTQRALVGVPADEERPEVGGLDPEIVARVTFGQDGADLPFPVPGMSDVMPYPSTVWSAMTEADLSRYRRTWLEHIAKAANDFAPDIIHTNHLWLMSALVPEAAPGVPVTAACHATGLRQMALCPGLADEVVRGCRRLDRFVVLRNDHREQVAEVLGVDPARISVTGAGYRDELFHPGPAGAAADQMLYVGKFSDAKGLPWLLDAVESLAPTHPDLRLHVAGAGAGAEADALRARMEKMAEVVMHGMLGQPDLADLMRRCGVCVLPSFYEGVPLVLVEAAACGCRIVSTDLPGVREQIAPALGPNIDLVPLPRLESIDRPVTADLPRFTADLAVALDRALAKKETASPADLDPFTWRAVFRRVEAVWNDLVRA